MTGVPGGTSPLARPLAPPPLQAPAAMVSLAHAYQGAAGPWAELASKAAVALLGATLLGCVSWAVETSAFHAFAALEGLGLIRRLIPDLDVSGR